MAAKGYKLALPGGPAAPQQHLISAQMSHRSVDVNKPMDRDYVRSLTGVTAEQAKAWENVRRIGEVHYALSRSARIAGYTTLYGEQVSDIGSPTARADSGVVARIVADITSRYGGLRGLVERFYFLRKVPGDMWLAALRDTPDEPIDGYWFLSRSECSLDDGTFTGKDRNGIVFTTARMTSQLGEKSNFQRLILPQDFYGRIWSPDFEYVENTDTPMISLNGLCDMLWKLTESIQGRLAQRFIQNGILLIPSEINDSAIAGDLPGNLDYGTNDKVMRYLIHIMTRNKLNLETAAGQIPILLKGPAEVLDKVRQLVDESTVAETDLQLRAELIDRILDGLDQQKGQVSGESGDRNRWTAWAASDEERRITVQPDIEAMCHALTRMILWRELRARGWEPERIRRWRIWYDISAAAVKSNITEEARQLWEMGLVGGKFVRKASGATDLDVMDPAEYVRWLGIQNKNPILATHGLQVDVDWDEAIKWGQKTGPAPDSPRSEPTEGPGGDPGAPGDRVDDQTPGDSN